MIHFWPSSLIASKRAYRLVAVPAIFDGLSLGCETRPFIGKGVVDDLSSCTAFRRCFVGFDHCVKLFCGRSWAERTNWRESSIAIHVQNPGCLARSTQRPTMNKRSTSERVRPAVCRPKGLTLVRRAMFHPLKR